MTEPAPVLHREEGATWWGLIWGPVLLVGGLLAQALLDSSITPLLWIALGLAVTGCVAVIIYARRQHVSVELTTESVRFGEEVVPLSDIREIAAIKVEDLPWETRALGGFMPPRRTTVIPLRMADGKLAAAWSQEPDQFRAALEQALAARPRPPEPEAVDEADPEPDPEGWPWVDRRNPETDA